MSVIGVRFSRDSPWASLYSFSAYDNNPVSSLLFQSCD